MKIEYDSSGYIILPKDKEYIEFIGKKLGDQVLKFAESNSNARNLVALGHELKIKPIDIDDLCNKNYYFANKFESAVQLIWKRLKSGARSGKYDKDMVQNLESRYSLENRKKMYPNRFRKD